MKNAWLPQELAKYIYQPDKTDANVRITGFTIKLDFGDFTRTAKLQKDGNVIWTEKAKPGKCLAEIQAKKEGAQ